MTSTVPDPLPQRIRNHVRAEVADAAIELFLAKGFDETTVDEICASVGLSRRSFFRQFSGKEDVVVREFTAVAEKGCKAFRTRPVGEDMWPALRRGMDPFVEWIEGEPKRAGALLRLVEQSPILRASYLDRVDRWRASLAAALTERLDAGIRSDLQIAVIAAACTGAHVAVARAWALADSDASPSEMFDEAFELFMSADSYGQCNIR